MSHEEDKEKHSKRIHKENAAIKRQVKLAKAFDEFDPNMEPHRYAKHHAHENYSPSLGSREPTKQEKSFVQQELWND